MNIGRVATGTATARELDEASVWAALAGHLLERLGVEMPLVIAVRHDGREERFTVPSSEGRTLRDAARAITPVEDDAGWTIDVEPRSLRLRGADTGVDLARALATLTNEALARPERSLSECAIVDRAERERLLAWGASDRSITAPATVCDRLFAGDAVVVDRDGPTSLRAIVERATKLAADLLAAGVVPGDRVGIHTARDASYLVSIFAAWLAGAAFVPLDARFPSARLAAMIDDARARCIVHDARAGKGDFAPETPRVVASADGAPDAFAARPAFRPRGEDVAYVLYTSGSTGRPKGVAITHANLASFLAAMTDTPGLGKDEPLLALTSFSFDISLLELLLPLWVGGTLVIAPDEAVGDPDAVAALVATHGVRVVQGTPTTFRLLLGSTALPPLRRFVGGEAFPRDLATELCARGGETWNMYGPTETTIWSAHGRVEQAPATAVVPLGRPIAGTFFRIVDARGRLVPWGARGELAIGGPGVGQGYLGRDDLTASRFVVLSGERVYKTGDAVRLQPDGSLEFLGRLDSQVKVRGYRIELGEVEVALRSVPGVTDGAAAVHELGGTATLVGYVVTRDAIDREALRAKLAERLPPYMIPTFIERLDALPLTANRKIDRGRLPPPSRPIASEHMTATERVVHDAIAKAFGVSAIGLDDDFSRLGGFSLSRFHAAKLLAVAGASVEGATLFEHPTIRGLARHVDTRTARASVVGTVADDDAVSENQVEIVLDAKGRTRRWTHTLVSPIGRDVDVARLEAAFRQTLARHADMLSSLVLADGRVRRVAPGADFEWDLRRVDLAPVRFEANGPTGGIVDVVREASERGFDVSEGPLHRFVVVDGAERYLVWATHDTTFDAWSSAVIRNEVGLVYEGYRGALPAVRRYREHVLRERRATDGLRVELAKHYGPASTTSALDPGRAPIARSALRHAFEPDAIVAAAGRLGIGATLLFEAAYALALARSEHAALIVAPASVTFGVYASNREVDEELGVGDYDALVPMRFALDPAMTVRDFADAARAEARTGLRFEAVGTRTWLSHLGPKAGARAFRVRFNDGQFPLSVEGLPKPKGTLFVPPDAGVFVPPALRLPGVDLEVAAVAGRPFVSALHDDAVVPVAVARRVLEDLVRFASRLATGDERTRLADLG